ncbi:MAG: hypothetical protein WC242_03830 [Candidatus Paceibacterota bacterium]|jgi:hypothetical protein
MSKGTVLYLSFGDAGVANRLRVAELRKSGCNVMTAEHIHQVLPVIEGMMYHGQRIDLVIIEPLTAMICQESRDMYERLRQTRFGSLPMLDDNPVMAQMDQGWVVVDLLNAIMSDTPIVIFTWYSKERVSEEIILRKFRQNPSIVRILDKNSVNVYMLVEEIENVFAEITVPTS